MSQFENTISYGNFFTSGNIDFILPLPTGSWSPFPVQALIEDKFKPKNILAFNDTPVEFGAVIKQSGIYKVNFSASLDTLNKAVSIAPFVNNSQYNSDNFIDFVSYSFTGTNLFWKALSCSFVLLLNKDDKLTFKIRPNGGTITGAKGVSLNLNLFNLQQQGLH